MSEQCVFAQKCVLKYFHFSTPLSFSAGKQGEIGESSSFISPSFQHQKEHLKYINHHNDLQEVGLKQLLTTYKDETCLRQFLASIVLLGYHLFLTNHMGQVTALQCQQQHQHCLSGRLPSGLHPCLPDSDSEAQTAPKGCFLPFLPRPLPACPGQLRRSSSMLCSRKCCSVGVAAVPPRGRLGACLGGLLQVWLQLFFCNSICQHFDCPPTGDSGERRSSRPQFCWRSLDGPLAYTPTSRRLSTACSSQSSLQRRLPTRRSCLHRFQS